MGDIKKRFLAIFYPSIDQILPGPHGCRGSCCARAMAFIHVNLHSNYWIIELQFSSNLIKPNALQNLNVPWIRANLSRLANKLRQRQIRKLVFVIFPDISPKGETKLGGKKTVVTPCQVREVLFGPGSKCSSGRGGAHPRPVPHAATGNLISARPSFQVDYLLCLEAVQEACVSGHPYRRPSVSARGPRGEPDSQRSVQTLLHGRPPHSFQMHFKELCFVTIEWRDPKTQS